MDHRSKKKSDNQAEQAKSAAYIGFRKYASDYKSRLVSADDGRRMKEEFVYTGDYFHHGLSSEREKPVKRQTLILSLLAVIGYAAAGLIDPDAMRSFFTALPYAVMLLPIGFMAAGEYRVLREKAPYKREAFDHSWKRLRATSLAAAILAAVSLVSAVIFMAVTGAHGRDDLLFLLLMAASGGCSLEIWRVIRKECAFETLEKDGKEGNIRQK